MDSCSKNNGCGCSGGSSVVIPAVKDHRSGTVLTLRIDKMDCPTEETLIRHKLASMPGVQDLAFNLMQRRLTVKHTLPDSEPIVAAISSLNMQPVIEGAPDIGIERQTVFHIENMDCPTEEALIRNKLLNLPGVTKLDFNLMQRRLAVSHTLPDATTIETALSAIGMHAVRDAQQVAQEDEAKRPAVSRSRWWLMAIAGMSSVLSEAIAFGTGNEMSFPVIALAVLAIATGGLETYKKGWIALRHGNLNMNALMSIAVTGAMAIGQWPEAAMVMFLFALAELIEQKSLDRARHAIRGLMDMAPETATVRQADGTWSDMAASAVPVGARVRVRPGERIPLDGKVAAGHSTVNQAPITGESVPVEKTINDMVFAGTINEAGSFEFEVTALASNTTLARIIHAVEEAQGTRAPTQRFVDQFARYYTPTVFVAALLVAVVPPIALGQAWHDWIYKALVLLVVACPCALVISTPVTIVSGLAAAARKGILVKGGVYLEQGRKLTWLALDKTGTLTYGRPSVTQYLPLPSSAQGVTPPLDLAASLAGRSDHPVSHAVAVYAETQGARHGDVEQFQALLGRGTEGTIAGQSYWLGNRRLAQERGQLTVEITTEIEALERQGNTVVMLGTSERVLAIFGVADTVRDTSRDAIAELHRLGVKTMMLTGDNEHTAQAIAKEVDIDDARGNQLPEDKLRVIEQIAKDGAVIGMVGDGINDAPALAQADIGFAMGAAGTDTAIETADVALMDDDLRKVASFVRLSRRTAAILKENIVLALGIKAVFLVLTFTGQATMWMAVFADMGASLIVVFNGLRLARK
ncbi:heavy metal translocating P-type ATPase [Noviherbaspirillum sp. 1P10PC]|uniref:heavy metal translocating P-type ATPase n=1 Tax=Noviherbaspirillum sp. 1P10PC TaxID=3132292 RepID=UPI0039A0C62D